MKKAYLRWSSIRQLANSMAVGLAMFLSAMLFPVFLVAWNIPVRNQGRWCVKTHACTAHVLRCLLNTHSFKDGVGMAVIGTGNEAGPSHQARTHVAHHVAVQVGHHHHVKLLRLGHQLGTTETGGSRVSVRMTEDVSALNAFAHLHGCVVHDHAVKRDVRVAGRHLSATLQEQAVAQLPVGVPEKKWLTFPASYRTHNKQTLCKSGRADYRKFTCASEQLTWCWPCGRRWPGGGLSPGPVGRRSRRSSGNCSGWWSWDSPRLQRHSGSRGRKEMWEGLMSEKKIKVSGVICRAAVTFFGRQHAFN